MNTFLSLIPLVLTLMCLVGLYAGVLKLAARLYRRTKLPWPVAFQFGGWVTLLVVLVGILRAVMPQWITGLLGLVAVTLFGAWFLGRRATDGQGQPIGSRRAAVLSGITAGLALVFGVTAGLLLFMLGPR
jgi:hypothetical protein